MVEGGRGGIRMLNSSRGGYLRIRRKMLLIMKMLLMKRGEDGSEDGGEDGSEDSRSDRIPEKESVG